jgi:hypothetical protein
MDSPVPITYSLFERNEEASALAYFHSTRRHAVAAAFAAPAVTTRQSRVTAAAAEYKRRRIEAERARLVGDSEYSRLAEAATMAVVAHQFGISKNGLCKRLTAVRRGRRLTLGHNAQ